MENKRINYTSAAGTIRFSVHKETDGRRMGTAVDYEIEAKNPATRMELGQRVPELVAAIENNISGAANESSFELRRFGACEGGKCRGDDLQLLPKGTKVYGFHEPDGSTYWSNRTFWAGLLERDNVCSCCGRKLHIRVDYPNK